ncbi:signal peptide peptidase SppA [Sphingomonas sp. HITSZ_GF]|uniref:signal peptide peptidase SppA n=1 Tax=Sphingomonas sp. HITSZ_GF TaxID=3037247 RepID=UPI00240E37D4|nr:signal peptide peptidase SppA [Sphingomonas sp. HITSZ_GF]MDG2533196.1 signal peptide peptidase SppA [Sphingomonas sp. HITSZ_GF]
MKLVKGAWKILVGIKDFLVLVFMLLFFTMLFAALSAKPNPAAIRDGALVVALDGTLVEQPEEVDPFARLTGGNVVKQQRLRDVVRALEAAKGDSHVKAVVLDLDRFMGGYPAAISEVAAAVGKVRAAGKPVLAYATAYTDDSYALAANASEIWMNPLGGAVFMGPGGTRLYYKGLLDKLGVNAHIYRVGKFKSAVEPYMRSDMSPEAKEAELAIYQPIWAQWQAEIAKARPKAKLADYLAKPADTIAAAKGDIAKSNLDRGIVDKLGDRLAFGKRVAEIAGAPSGKPEGSFNRIKLDDFVAANPLPTGGDAIGVITIAGEIVDGKAGPGKAAGDSVSALLLKGLATKNLKALVVRVDSPGGSALAAEQIRQAILTAKAKGLPVVVSMGSLAASGGYWVATPGDTIFAEPNTITGSIGIFGVIPTFEKSLAKIGVGTDGVKTTPLSGQPDVYGGTTEETDKLLQSAIDAGYARFISLVSGARKLTPERVNEIAQGRVWIGGTAHQLGLVDRFGGIDDAIAEAARRAKLDPAKVHAVYLEKEPSAWAKLLEGAFGDGEDDADKTEETAGPDLFARAAIEQRAMLAQALGDARRLARGGSVQARCLECGALGPANASLEDRTLFDAIAARLGL